jgi:hypothetical protein
MQTLPLVSDYSLVVTRFKPKIVNITAQLYPPKVEYQIVNGKEKKTISGRQVYDNDKGYSTQDAEPRDEYSEERVKEVQHDPLWSNTVRPKTLRYPTSHGTSNQNSGRDNSRL